MAHTCNHRTPDIALILSVLLIVSCVFLGWAIQNKFDALQEEKVMLYDFIDDLDQCKSLNEVFYLRDSLKSELQFLDE